MKAIYKITAAGLLLASCAGFDKLAPQGGTLLASQVKTANEYAPSRGNAPFNGMYTNLGAPASVYGGGVNGRPDDFGMAFVWAV